MDHVTDLAALVAKGATDGDRVFNPMTPPFDTTQLDEVRVGFWLDSNDVSVKTAVQFSDNGVEFDAAIVLDSGASYENTAGWTHPTAFTSLFGLTGTKRGYCRFGLLAINDSGSATGSGQARLSIEQRPSAGRSVFGGPIKVNTDGTTTAIFHPLTGALQAADMAELRATLRLESASGLDGSDNSLIQLQPGYQQSDTPDDWNAWATAVSFGTNATTEGTHFGTTFESVSPTKTYIRFGVLAKNDSDSSDIEACCVTLRVDARD